MKKAFAIFLLGVFLVVGVFTMVQGGRQLREGLAARAWPTVEGIVVSAEVATEHSRASTYYRPHVAYRYRVAGVDYTSDRFSALGSERSSRKEEIEKRVASMAPDSRIQVFYNASNPSASMLSPGVGRLDWLVLIIGAGLVALSSGGLYSIKKHGVYGKTKPNSEGRVTR